MVDVKVGRYNNYNKNDEEEDDEEQEIVVDMHKLCRLRLSASTHGSGCVSRETQWQIKVAPTYYRRR